MADTVDCAGHCGLISNIGTVLNTANCVETVPVTVLLWTVSDSGLFVPGTIVPGTVDCAGHCGLCRTLWTMADTGLYGTRWTLLDSVDFARLCGLCGTLWIVLDTMDCTSITGNSKSCPAL